MKLSVVIPVCNEADNVEPLVTELHHVLTSLSDPLEFEIVYVDDGSTDGTPARLASLARIKWVARQLAGQ